MTTAPGLEAIETDLNEVRANVGHADAQYNPWALQALNIADELFANFNDARALIIAVQALLIKEQKEHAATQRELMVLQQSEAGEIVLAEAERDAALAELRQLRSIAKAAFDWRHSPHGAGSWNEGRVLINAVDEWQSLIKLPPRAEPRRRPRGTCSFCSRSYQVTTKGLLRGHLLPGVGIHRKQRRACEGSGLPPRGEDR